MLDPQPSGDKVGNDYVHLGYFDEDLYFSDRQSTESIYKFSIDCIKMYYQNVNRVVAAGNKESGHTDSSTNPEHPVERPESPEG